MGRSAVDRTGMSWRRATDFVFVFRVRKVCVKPKPAAARSGPGEVMLRRVENYRSGAFA